MLLSLRKDGLTSLFKEVRVFKGILNSVCANLSGHHSLFSVHMPFPQGF